MTPRFRIIANGVNITPLIEDRLIRLTVTDNAGLNSDTVSIILNDQDNRLAHPKKGAEFEIHMGHSGIGMAPMGLFTVNAVSISGPPDRLTIDAKAVETHKSLTKNRVDNYDAVTIGDLVTVIATRHKLIPKVDPLLASIRQTHLVQNDESDLHLLIRTAEDVGAVVKATPRFLLFTPKEHAQGVSGNGLKPVAIKKKDLSAWSFSFSERGDDKSDMTAQKPCEPLFEAKATGRLSLTVGNPFVLAETSLILPDMLAEVTELSWVVKSAIHTINGESDEYMTDMGIQTEGE